MVAGDLDGDGIVELLILHPGQQIISIWRLGETGYVSAGRLDAGKAPVSLSLAQFDGTGAVDVLVGNQFGDVLIWESNGNGSFEKQFSTRIDRSVSLAPFAAGVVVASRSQDDISQVLDDAPDDLNRVAGGFAPEMVRLIDLNGDDVDDLVVANSGNIEQDDVLVYLAVSEGVYSQIPLGFGSGTDSGAGVLANPIAVTQAILNDDDYPDLVVTNFGSDSVAVLLSETEEELWTGFSAPALTSVGRKPVSSELRDVTGDRVVDLLVTSSLDGTVELLKGTKNNDRVEFSEPAGRIELGGPTREQGAVYGEKEGFVAMADGSVVRFSLDAFVNPSGTTSAQEIELRSIDPAAGIEDVVVLQAVDFDANGRSELFVAGFDANRQPAVAVLGVLRHDLYLEIPFSTPAALDAPADLAVRQTSSGQIELLVGQDNTTEPVIRILAGTAGQILDAIRSSFGFLSISTRLATASAVALPFDSSNPDPLRLAAGLHLNQSIEDTYGSDNSFMGLIEIIARAIEPVYDVFRVYLHSLARLLGDHLYSQLTETEFRRFGELLKEALSMTAPGGVAFDLAQIISNVGQVVSNGLPEDVVITMEQALDVARIDSAIKQVRRDLETLLDVDLKQRLEKLAEQLAQLPPAAVPQLAAEEIGRFLQEIRRKVEDISETLRSSVRSVFAPRLDEQDQVDSLLRIVTIGLLCAGTGGLTWHMVDKYRARMGNRRDLV